MTRLSKAFFQKPTLKVARALLGKILVTKINGKITSGKIVEVEAYHEKGDKASHSYRRRTKRNLIMFGPGGYCYVYFIYGNHFCVNVVTEKEGVGAAVLIRALEPVKGVEVMRRRRKISIDENLTNGPGKLCQALGIDSTMGGENFSTSRRIWIENAAAVPSMLIKSSKRIGISKSTHLPWRFFIRNNSWVSKK